MKAQSAKTKDIIEMDIGNIVDMEFFFSDGPTLGEIPARSNPTTPRKKNGSAVEEHIG